ncbi:MAG: hypothetical protein ACOCRX_05650 [Candidatus Woesearchaeota archaeon]
MQKQQGIVNSYKVPVVSESLGRMELNIILTIDAMGMRACYMGHGSNEFVYNHGRKLRFDEAKSYYPYLKEEKYRH